MRLLAALLTAVLAGSGGARAAGPWDQWQLLMWQYRTPAQMRGLAALGFTGAMVTGKGGNVDRAGVAARGAAGLGFYLENIATDFYAPYHRYLPGKPVTWLFDEARALHRSAPDDPAAFVRVPGLSDPAWLAEVSGRLERVARDTVERPGGARPLFYNLADESGIADLAAAWDFDVAPESLAGFRDWLRAQYGGLAALNAEWGTGFASWEAVVPRLTDAAVAQAGENFAAWADFKAWMDEAFARAVQAGTDGVHRGDAAGLSALEGAQVPGWGGYDYARLAPAVDVMEIYDFGEALDLAAAFHPGLIALRTSFGSGPREAHAVWRSVLHGGRGMVVWDEADDVVGADGAAGPRGRELAGLAAAVRPVAALLAGGTPSSDAVAVLYSQASFRVQWLLDRRAGDHDWAARDAAREYEDNAWRASRRVLVGHLAELGVQPRYLSSGELAAGMPEGVRVLFLPDAIALSDEEVAAVGRFRAGGGTVYADRAAGVFDGHGRRRAVPALGDVASPEAVRTGGGPSDPAMLQTLAGLLRDAGAAPRVAMAGPDGQTATGVEARWFETAAGTVLALQAAVPWGGPPVVQLRLPRGSEVRVVKGEAAVGPDGVEVRLGGIEPVVLTLTR